MKKDREEKTKFSKILPNNQIITAYHIELLVQEMTMNEKLTLIGLMLIWNVQLEDNLLYGEIVDPSQMKMTFHFFPQSGVLRKTSLTL